MLPGLYWEWEYLEQDCIGKDMAMRNAKQLCDGLYDGSEAARYQEDLASSALQPLHKLRNACSRVCGSVSAGTPETGNPTVYRLMCCKKVYEDPILS